MAQRTGGKEAELVLLVVVMSIPRARASVSSSFPDFFLWHSLTSPNMDHAEVMPEASHYGAITAIA